MTRILSAADVATVEPGKLAEAVREYCRVPWMQPKFNGTDWQKFAAALLAALDECDTTGDMLRGSDANCELEARVREKVIRVIARVLIIEHGVKLEVADE